MVAILLFVGLSAVVLFGAVYYREILLLLGKDPTLTGRTGIWKLVIASAVKRPILGFGYRAFWTGLQGESAHLALTEGWSPTGAHNGFLDVWLNLGLVGLGIVFFLRWRGPCVMASLVSSRASRQPRPGISVWFFSPLS